MTWNFADDFHSPILPDPFLAQLSDPLHHNPLGGLPGLDPMASYTGSGFESHPLVSHDLDGGHPATTDLGHHPLFSDSHEHHSDITFGASSDKSDDHWRDEMNAKHYEEEAKRDAEKAEQALKDGDPDKAAMHLSWAEREADRADMHRGFMNR